MLIVLHSGGIPFNGSTVDERSLGGSESAAYYVARELAERGHEVKVFTNIEEKDWGVFDGVEYLGAGNVSEHAPLGELFELWARSTPMDVLIVQRHPLAFHKAYPAKVTLHWLHDLGLIRQREAYHRGAWQVDRFMPVSQWHKAQLEEILKLPPDVVTPLPNGVDADLFADTFENHDIEDTGLVVRSGPEATHELIVDKRKAPRLIYSSRPERGLEHLVKEGGIMEQLVERLPEAHLYVCGYQHDVPSMREYYGWLMERCAALPNVTIMGHLTKEELATAMEACHALVYPTTFEEVSCITAMEAMHAGLPMITTPVAALPETCEGAGVEMIPLKDGQPDVDQFVRALMALAFDMAGHNWEARRKQQLKAAARYTWARSTDRLLEIVYDVFAKKTENPEAMALHLRHVSDIVALERYIESLPRVTRDSSAILTRIGDELATLYAPIKANSLASHYDATAEEEIANGSGDVIDLRGHPRIEALGDMLATLHDGAAVLDVGCYLGGPACTLANRLPTLNFTGVDVSYRATSTAMSQTLPRLRDAFDTQLDNVCFFQVRPDLQDLVDSRAGSFDAIILAEVLEHQWDFHAFLDQAVKLLKPGGKVFITVPFGPWESESYRTSAYREHVHHFERDDIRRVFGHLEDCTLRTIASAPAVTGEVRGWQLVGFTWTGKQSFGMVDYKTKFAQQAPRETVSLCMIVKNGASSIPRLLDSIRDTVDEVLLYVDAEASLEDYEKTCQVIQLTTGDWDGFPYVEVRPSRVSALRDGFDAARNASIEDATGDWILWLDADEELVNAHRMPAFMRNNGYTGYSVEQHHLSIDPPGTLTVDKPCRLFRNRRGVKFYGVVHEHPEAKFGEGVGHAILLAWPKIAHTGYYTEDVRRKRFSRNFALMQRDRKTYPDRVLGKFLWLRDCTLMCGYLLERHGQVTQQIHAYAREGLKMYEELLDTGHLRYLSEGLVYYSRLTALLGIGFEAELSARVAQPGAALAGAQPHVLTGRFASTDHYRRLNELLMKEQVADFGSTYF